MKPGSPFVQHFDGLPAQLPLYVLENALLPGGELPLELFEPRGLALFQYALKADQLIGMVQPQLNNPDDGIYPIGCAGRIRQYRERKDGRLNVMLTGICRYRIVETITHEAGYTIAGVDWKGFETDYENEDVDSTLIESFTETLRNYFDRHRMRVDWDALNKLPIEQVVNNLVLILNLNIASKQQLLESPTVTQRLELFSSLLANKADPILASSAESKRVN